MNIVCWNVNGLRSVVKKGNLEHMFAAYTPEIFFLMETKVQTNQLDESVLHRPGYDFILNPSAARPGHSGTALYVKQNTNYTVLGFDEVLIPFVTKMKRWYVGEAYTLKTRSGVSNRIMPDQPYTVLHEGRLIAVKLQHCIIIGCYFPNGGDRVGMDGLYHKMCFYDCCTQYMQSLQKQNPDLPVILMGDVNITLTDLDLARPESNKNSVGCIALDRKNLGTWQNLGWVDVFRQTNPNTQVYSWWDTITGARARNVGWRIDSVWMQSKADCKLQVQYLVECMGSDHCPLLIQI